MVNLDMSIAGSGEKNVAESQICKSGPNSTMQSESILNTFGKNHGNKNPKTPPPPPPCATPAKQQPAEGTSSDAL